MSLFRSIETPCPSCAVPVKFDLVHSVNADRRPALREEILARTFQRQSCPSCGDIFRIEPEFTYLHMAGKLWLAVWPASKMGGWADIEQRSRKAFEAFYGPGSSPAAQAIGRELKVRVSFGWEATHEKLVLQDNDIDDVTLELAKIALLRDIDGLSPGDNSELRLLGVNDQDQMVLGRFESGSEALVETLSVPKTLLDEIDAQAKAWQGLREKLGAGPFVDLARLTLATAAAQSAA